MQLSIVVAIAKDGAIGRNGTLPWRLSGDLQYFKRVTFGKPIIMGRRTWESLNGKPLKGRTNIVLSHNLTDLPEGIILCENLDMAIAKAAAVGCSEAAIIGGSSLFAESIPKADILHITRVQAHIADADTFFPNVDLSPFRLAWEEGHEADEKNEYAYTFQRWERKQA